jgi:hypothetical protein
MTTKIKEKMIPKIVANCKNAADILTELYPEYFKKNDEPKRIRKIMTDDPPDNQTRIKEGLIYYTIHGTPKGFKITKSQYPFASFGAWKIFTGNSSGEINAERWVICNTKRFTLEDIYTCIDELGYDSGLIISKLNEINDPSQTIMHKDESNIR